MTDQESTTNTDTPNVNHNESANNVSTETVNTTGVDNNNDDKDPRITRANREAASYRTQLRRQEQANTELEEKLSQRDEQWGRVLKALGVDDEGQSPEERLKEAQAATEKQKQDHEALEREYRAFKTRTFVANAAREAGADGELIADLLAGRGALDGLDLDGEDFQTQVAELVKDTVEKYPSLMGRKTPTVSSGNAPAPAGDPNQKLTREDLAKMSPAEINKAVREGKLGHLLSRED